MAAGRNITREFVVVLLLSARLCCSGIVPPLEREISISLRGEKITTALKRIEEQAHVVFSYQPDVIAQAGPVTLSLVKKTVREAIAALFNNRVTGSSRHNHIILKQKAEPNITKKTAVTGYVYEQQSGNKLGNVTIYDPATLRSTTSDRYGYYEMPVAPATTLSINKLSYQDTTLTVHVDSIHALRYIGILPVSTADSLEWKMKLKELQTKTGKLFRQFNGYLHVENVRDSITRNFQLSFVPFAGTNHKMSGNVYNRVSLNVLGGYARGTTAFEAGGLFNVDRENVSAVQLAGLFNIVGDSVKGAQAAGLFNLTGRKSEGFQAAGLTNINRGSAHGCQLAGLLNVSRTSKGVSLAGISNIADTSTGFNGAGLFNASKSARSVQLAGLFNAAGETEVQIAGLFNAARTVKKMQIGVFNFCDSTTGVPIGVLSFAGNGQHQLEISGDEWFYLNASFRTGVKKFYNILTAGMQPGGDSPIWQVGYGIGSSFRIGRSFRTDLNLSIHHVSKGEMIYGPSELIRFHPAIEYAPSGKFAIALGPTFNFYHTDALTAEYGSTYSQVVPYFSFENNSGGGYNQKGWIGAKLSLRFF